MTLCATWSNFHNICIGKVWRFLHYKEKSLLRQIFYYDFAECINDQSLLYVMFLVRLAPALSRMHK